MNTFLHARGKIAAYRLGFFFFLFFLPSFLVQGCSFVNFLTKLDYQQSAPWFEGEVLTQTPVVLLPVFKSNMEEEPEGLDAFLASVARKKLKGSVFDARSAREVLEEDGLDQEFDGFLKDFVSVEVLDKEAFGEFSRSWEGELNTNFSMLTEIKNLKRFRNISTNESTKEVDGQNQISEKTTFTSGVTVTLRLSVIRNSDGELAWVGEKVDRMTKENSQTRIVEGPGKTSSGDAILENMVGSALFGGGDPYSPAHPAYPSYESAIEKGFVILLKSLKKTKISSPQ